MADATETIDLTTWLAAAGYNDAEAEALGLRSVVDGGSIYCACVTRAAFADQLGRRHQWPKGSTVRWHIGMTKLGALSDLDMKEARERTCAEIASYIDPAGLKLEYTPNGKTANVICRAAQIDGQGQILADQEVPMGVVTSDRVLQGRFDLGERFTISKTAVPGMIDWERTDKHEFLHALGFFHGKVDKSNPALLEPMYSWSIWALQPRDIEELQARYGVAPAAPPPPSAPSEKGATVTVEVAGVKYKIQLNPTAANIAAVITAEFGGKSATLSGAKPWA